MFTGLVETLAEIADVIIDPPGVRLVVREASVAAESSVGDSVAINGCCLTVVAIKEADLSFEAGVETLSRTNLGELAAGKVVNLERSLRVGEPVGGHYVTGHIDAQGAVDQRIDEGTWSTMWLRAPTALLKQMASKGSVAVDGVSLTLVDVTDDRFSVALIPHTLAVTTLGLRQAGDSVNLETDILAKYVEKSLSAMLGRSEES